MAKVAAQTNAYAVNGELTDNDVPTYAPPASGDYTNRSPLSQVEDGNMDSPIGAWANGLDTGQLRGTPDAMRLGSEPSCPRP